jgi:transglutaminase-like putative cysteine protease
MPEFKIQHTTKYAYDGFVRDSANKIILYPIVDIYQDVLKHDLHISGHPQVDTYVDYYGNEVGSFTYTEPHNLMVINSQLSVSSPTQGLYRLIIFSRQSNGTSCLTCATLCLISIF